MYHDEIQLRLNIRHVAANPQPLLGMRYEYITRNIRLRPQVQSHNFSSLHLVHCYGRQMATTTLRDGIEVKFSAGTDTESLLSPFLELTQPARGLGWKLTPQGNAIERTFKFKTFKKTWVGFFFSFHNLSLFSKSYIVQHKEKTQYN